MLARMHRIISLNGSYLVYLFYEKFTITRFFGRGKIVSSGSFLRGIVNLLLLQRYSIFFLIQRLLLWDREEEGKDDVMYFRRRRE